MAKKTQSAVSDAARLMGRIGGKKTSPAKAKASRKNFALARERLKLARQKRKKKA